MGFGRKSLVRQLHESWEAAWTHGDRQPSIERNLAELSRRVRRLHSLGDHYSAVRLSEHIVGLRAASVPDRAWGVASPGNG